MLRKFFLGILLAGISAQSYADVEINIKRVPDWPHFFQQVISRTLNNLPSAAVSAALGALSGSLVGLLDNNNMAISLLIAWPAEMYLRNMAVESVEEEMDNVGISYNRQTMYWTARIASWLGWLACLKEQTVPISGPYIIIKK